MTDFEGFRKIPRLFRDITITEKIDGSNGQIYIEDVSDNRIEVYDDGNGYPVDAFNRPVGGLLVQREDQLLHVRAGSRNRWVDPDQDNHGFASWVYDNVNELVKLGPGRHFGEWWGSGIQRGYGLQKGERRFSLFNTKKWTGNPELPECCSVVPVLYTGDFSTYVVEEVLHDLGRDGSVAAPGFMRPEGGIVYHHALNNYFKVTLENDEAPKGQVAA